MSALEGDFVKTQIESVTGVKKVLHVEIPWEEVDKHVRESVRKISRSARISGFRPGKAPESLIRSRYAQQIKDDVIQHLVPEAYQEVLEENQFDIVSEPSLHDVMYSEGSPLLFKVTIETKPAIELKEYKSLDLKGEKIQVKEEEMDRVLKAYQDRAAELVPQEDTPAASGHFLNALVRAHLKQKGSRKKLFEDKTVIELGSADNHAAFNENLQGKRAGETVEFDAAYPDDYEEKSIAGKIVHYTVTVEAVNDKRVPPIDDDLAKDLGDFNSLEELKEKIRKDLSDAKSHEQHNHFKEEVLKKLIDLHPFEVPEGLVRKETESLMHSYAYALQRRGIKLDSPEVKWEEIQRRLSKQADENIRGSMIVDAISDAEKITVTDDDVEKEIIPMAEKRHRAPEAVKAELIKEKRLDDLKRRLLIGKTLDFVIDHAKIELMENV